MVCFSLQVCDFTLMDFVFLPVFRTSSEASLFAHLWAAEISTSLTTVRYFPSLKG